jgi:hypothetical protein
MVDSLPAAPVVLALALVLELAAGVVLVLALALELALLTIPAHMAAWKTVRGLEGPSSAKSAKLGARDCPWYL